MATRRQLEEQQAQAAIDLAEVDEQLAAGEFDGATADRMRARYRREMETIAAQLAGAPEDEPTGRSLNRTLIGTALMVIATIGVVFLVAGAVDDREAGQFATGSIEGRDLSEVSTEEMERVVAEFPGVVDMRLALARRYFEAGDFSSALPHYLTILETQQDNPEANANVGWMTYLSDPSQAPVAATLLERSLAVAPDYQQAIFFLANVRLYGLDDPAGARPLLEKLSEDGELPDDIADVVDELLNATAGSS